MAGFLRPGTEGVIKLLTDMQGQNPDKTVISREYPTEWTPGMEPYYPVNDERNSALFAQYQELAKTRPDVIFGGRLGNYRYYDMDQVIRAALDAVKMEMLNA